jgi:hypothetical protein
MAAIVNISLTRIVTVMVFAGFTRIRAIVKPVTRVSAKGRNWVGSNGRGFCNGRKLEQKLGW